MSFQAFHILLATLALASFAACKSKLEVKKAATKAVVESDDFLINAPDKAYLGEKITVEWTEVDGAQYYNLVLATDENCKDVAFSVEDLEQNRSTITTTSPGTYYLCVFVKVKGKPLSKANDKSVEFNVLVSSPAVQSVSTSLSDGTFGIGSVIDIKVIFDQVVSVDGPLKLKLETGATDREATYVGGYGSKILTFNYTVQAGDESIALDVDSSFPNMYDGTIKNTYNVSANMSLPFGFMEGSLSQDHEIKVDGIAPVVSSGTLTSDPAYLTGTSFKIIWTGATDTVASASELEYKLVYSTTDNISSAADAEANGIDVGSYTANILEASPGSLTPLTIYYYNVLVRDLGGNVSVYSRGTETTPTGPSITSVTTAKADDSYTTGEVIDLVVTYDESVTVAGGTPTLKLETGTTDRTATYTGGSPGTALTFRYTVQSGDTSTNLDVHGTAPQISLAGATIKSTNTNANANHSAPKGADPGSLAGSSDIVIDTTAPTVGTSALTINVTDIAAMDVRVSWTAASDNIAAASALQYKVVYSSSDDITTLSQANANGTVGVAYTANITQGDITGLTPGAIYYFNVIVKDDAGNESVFAKKANPLPPTISFTAPAGTNVIAQSATYALTWTASDPNGLNPSIALYYSTVNTGTCSSKTALSTSLTMNGAAGTHNWNVSAVTAGTYYVCAVIDNGETSPVTAWSSGTISVNAVPTFTFVQPLASDDFIKAGGSFAVTWTDSDADNDATISLYYKTANSGACSTGTQFATGISEDDATNSETWTTLSTQTSNNYYFCARISDGVNTAVEVWSERLVVYHECLWNTSGTTAWATTSNWTGCNNVAPTYWDHLVIPNGGTQPTISNSGVTQVAKIGSFAIGGGTITVNAGSEFRLYTANSPAFHAVESDITFAAQTPTCTTCTFSIPEWKGAFVVNNATLTILDGINWGVWFTNGITFGDGTSAGHLVFGTGNADSTQWPYYWGGSMRFNGSFSTKSSLTLNGAKFIAGPSPNYNAKLDFLDNYEVKRLDNLIFTEPSTLGGNSIYVSVKNCINSVFTDTSWDNLILAYPSYGGHSTGNVLANDATCSGSTPITISGSGFGYGEALDNDPYNIVAWTNGATSTCTWTGAVNTAWNNAGNWNNCSNGRNNYPDTNDLVIIPSGGNQPVVSGSSGAWYFATGTGGGTITVEPGAYFYFIGGVNDGVNSDISFVGSAPGCTTCNVVAGTFGIRYKTLTIGTGITMTTGYVYVWSNNTGSGGIVANGGTNPSHWPSLRGRMQCEGSGIYKSRFLLDGLNTAGHWIVNNACQLSVNNVNMNETGRFEFDTSGCTNSNLNISMTNLTFNGTILDMRSVTGCAGAGPLNVYPNGTGGPGYLPATANDAGGIFVFH